MAGELGEFLPFDAATYLDATGARVPVAPSVVLAFADDALPKRSHLTRARDRLAPTASGPFRDLRHLTEGVDLVLASGPGPAVAAATVDMLAALGVERVVTVGVCAGTADLPTGSVCVVADTVDPHGQLPMPYPEPGTRSGADFDALAAAGPTRVTAHTTPWPFRVPSSVLDAHQLAAGPPLVIEMEARAVFAAAGEGGIEANALVAVSDGYGPTGWQLGDPNVAAAALGHAVEIASEVLGSRHSGSVA